MVVVVVVVVVEVGAGVVEVVTDDDVEAEGDVAVVGDTFDPVGARVVRKVVVARGVEVAMCDAFMVLEVAMAVGTDVLAVRRGVVVTTCSVFVVAMGGAALSVSDVVPDELADTGSTETINERTASDSPSRPTSANRYPRERGGALVEERRPNAARRFLE